MMTPTIRRLAPPALAAASLLIGACTAADGEPDICDDCVAHESVATLSFAGAPSYPDAFGTLATNGSGDRRAFVARSAPYEVLVFGAAGQLEATVGSRGEGPGGFDDIRVLAFDADGQLWVASRDGSRLDVFGPDLALRSSEQMPGRITHLAPVAGGMAAGLATADRGQVGLLSPSGDFRELWSRAAGDTEFAGGLSAFETDGDQRIWFAEEYSYRVWQADLSGTVRAMVEGAPEWFGAQFQPEVAEQVGGRDATITVLDHDPEADLLWMVTGVPSEDLTTEELAAMFQDPDLAPDAMLAAMIDHVIEAFSAADGTLTARSRRDLPVSASSSNPFRLDGTETLVILRLLVER